MKIPYILLLLVLFAIAIFILQQKNKPQIEPSGYKVKVGIIGPLNGDNMSRGMMGIRGIKIAQLLIPYLNNGDEIEWVAKDDQGMPEQSIRALKTLVETDKVNAVLMLSGSDVVLAIAKIADQYKIPILTVFASHPDITKHSSFVNQFNFDDRFQASVAALYIRDELLLNKVAIITQSDNIHLSFLANEFTKQFKAAEGLITDSYNLQTTKPGYLQILQKIRKTDPELLYLPVSMEHLFRIKLALIELDWNPMIMVSDGIFASARGQNKYPLNLINGVLAIDTYSYDTEFTPFGKQLLKQVVSMGVNKYDIGTYGALGMEGYTLLVKVMNQCDVLHNMPICINKSIRSTSKFEGIKGFISFDEKGKAHRSLVVNKMVDGTTKFVVQVY